jgi:hypothetical protein
MVEYHGISAGLGQGQAQVVESRLPDGPQFGRRAVVFQGLVGALQFGAAHCPGCGQAARQQAEDDKVRFLSHI